MARILMIAYTTYVHDGRVQRHAQALAERGDKVDLLCLQNPLQGLHNGVNVIGLKIPRYRGSSRSSYFRTYLRFFAVAGLTALRMGLRKRYDVVVVCTMPDAAVLCALPLRLLGSKVVLDMHDTMPELYLEKFGGRRGAFGARLLAAGELASTKLANRVLAVHDPHRLRLESTGIPGQKISVVLNVPDQRIFRFVPGANNHSNRFRIFCHGTITQRLGLDVAIEAMSLLQSRLPEAQLCIAGNGDYLARCEQMVERMQLGDSVRFFGSVPFEQLPGFLRQAAVGLIPNRASAATHLMLPVKLLEYTTLGIPVIASRLKTIAYYFDDSALKFVEPGSASALAAAIEELYNDPAQRRGFADRARICMDSIKWEHQIRSLYGAVDSLLKRPQTIADELYESSSGPTLADGSKKAARL